MSSVVLAAPALFVGLLIGILFRRWWVVIAIVSVGVVVSIAGWQAAWFADQETPALGGAIVFELLIGAPIAIGAGLGVYLICSRGRLKSDL
jgi:hypothetical protein